MTCPCLPEMPRPLADPAVMVEGRHVFIRRGENIATPSGQMVIDFDAAKREHGGDTEFNSPVAIPFAAADSLGSSPNRCGALGHPFVAEEFSARWLPSSKAMAVRIRQSSCTAPSWCRASRRRTTISRWRSCSIAAGILPRLASGITWRSSWTKILSRPARIWAVSWRSKATWPWRKRPSAVLAQFHPDYADAHYHLARLLDHAHRAVEAAGTGSCS